MSPRRTPEAEITFYKRARQALSRGDLFRPGRSGASPNVGLAVCQLGAVLRWRQVRSHSRDWRFGFKRCEIVRRVLRPPLSRVENRNSGFAALRAI